MTAPPSMRGWRGRAAALALLVLGGCAAFSDRPPPTPLQPLAPKLAGRQLWSVRLPGTAAPIAPVLRGGTIMAAAADGTVLALEAATGREQWRVQAGARITAGVGSDGRLHAVVTGDNELVAIGQGQVLWRRRLNSAVLTPPLVAGERVFVLAIDRSVQAFDGAGGARLWGLQRQGDALTLAQPGVLTAHRNTLIVGQGPRWVGVDPSRGSVRWDVALANPRGTNEVERLADLVGPAARIGDVFCARAFQAAVGCVDAERGALVWTRNAGGTDALAADARMVVAADATDRVAARRTTDGDPAWTQESMLHRGLSGAASYRRSVVFGDSEGQLHFLDRDSGEPLLRLPTDGTAVLGTPVVADELLLVTTRGGGLFAFRTE